MWQHIILLIISGYTANRIYMYGHVRRDEACLVSTRERCYYHKRFPYIFQRPISAAISVLSALKPCLDKINIKFKK